MYHIDLRNLSVLIASRGYYLASHRKTINRVTLVTIWYARRSTREMPK
jgi:hypothetical protein